MTQVELVEGEVRGATFLESLAPGSISVVGPLHDASPALRLLLEAGAYVRVVPEPARPGADLTGAAVVVVTTPSALKDPAVAAAREAGVLVLSDLDVAWLVQGVETFAIAGGAETATQLAAAALGTHARFVNILGTDEGGGYGEPDFLVVAPSSDQLATMQVFRPRVAVMLRGANPLAVRLTARQSARDCLVLLDDDPIMVRLARATRAHVVWLSTGHPLEHGVYVEDGFIAARLNGYVEEICPAPRLSPVYLEDALAAVACALWAGLDPGLIGKTLTRRFATERVGADRIGRQVRRAG